MALLFLASIVPYRAYKTRDGDILLGGGNDRLYGILCDRLGCPEWKTDARFVSNDLRVKHRAVLDGMIEERTKQKTTQEWLDILEGSGMPYSAINDIRTTLNHEHGELNNLLHPLYWYIYADPDKIVKARGMVQEVVHPTCGSIKLVNTPIKYFHATPGIRTPPPTLGQHTDEILRGLLRFEEEKIAELRQEGVVA